jgi:serine/threonine protein kinase
MSEPSPNPTPDDPSREPLPGLSELKRRVEAVASMEQFLQLTRDAGAETRVSPPGPDPGDPSGLTRTSAGVGDPVPRPSAYPSVPGYEILGELARGGMGVVYKARHVRLNRPVEVKMILGGKYHDPAARLRFVIEAEAVAQLAHPHIGGV